MVGTLIRRPGTLTTGPITSGVYVPTHYLGINMAGSTAYNTIWTRIGDRVIVSGVMDIDPIATGGATLGITLPVASDFAGTLDCTGVFGATTVTETGIIMADFTNNNAALNVNAVTTTNHQGAFVFQYRVL